MSFVNPTVAQFKAQFVRDFNYTGNDPKGVMDADITQALLEANFNFPSFSPDQPTYSMLFCYLAAHMMVQNIDASTKGLQGRYSWIEVAKSVGNVSQTFQIPQYLLEKPEISMLCSTKYGAKYVQLILPYLKGQMWTSCRRTEP